MNGQAIIFCHRICHEEIYASRISLISFRAVQLQCNTVFRKLLYFPHSLIRKISAAVQCIALIIICKRIRFAVQLEGSSANTVCHSSDYSTDKAGSLFVSGGILITKDYICQLSFPVRHKQLYKICSIICNTGTHSGRIPNLI